MENSPRNTGESNLSDFAVSQSDAERARDYIEDIGGAKCQIQTRIFNAFTELNKRYGDYWTERKVRAIHGKEIKTIGFSRMLQLHETAAEKKAKAKLLEQARREHAQFIEKNARMATFLQATDEAFHSPQVEGIQRSTGRMDRSRTD